MGTLCTTPYFFCKSVLKYKMYLNFFKIKDIESTSPPKFKISIFSRHKIIKFLSAIKIFLNSYSQFSYLPHYRLVRNNSCTGTHHIPHFEW